MKPNEEALQRLADAHERLRTVEERRVRHVLSKAEDMRLIERSRKLIADARMMLGQDDASGGGQTLGDLLK
jgi:hypothetical protein